MSALLTQNELDSIAAFVDLAMPSLEARVRLATDQGAPVPTLIQMQVIADAILSIYIKDQKLANDTPEIRSDLTSWGTTH